MRSQRALEALQGLGGEAPLSKIARRAELDRKAAYEAMILLSHKGKVAGAPLGARTLSEPADWAERVWRLL